MESSAEQPSNGFQSFRLYWAGKGTLSVAYWGFGVAGSFIIQLFSVFGLLFIVPFAKKNGGGFLESTAFKIYFFVVLLVLLAYQLLVSILIWRNANNTSNRIWSDLAKAVVAFGVAFLLYQLVKLIVEAS